MGWVKIDDGAPEHRKLLEAGAVAAWLWVCGLAYCNRQKARDGFIPAAKVAALYPVCNAKREADRLVAVGLWDVVEGGYVVHDYHEFQPSAEAAEERRQKRSSAGKLGGIRSGTARSSKQIGSKLLQQSKQVASTIEANGSYTVEANANPVPDPDPVASTKQEDPPTPASRSVTRIRPEPARPDHPVAVMLTDNAWVVAPQDPLVVAGGLIAMGRAAKREPDELAEAVEMGLLAVGRKASGDGVGDGAKYLAAVVHPLLAAGGLEAARAARATQQAPVSRGAFGGQRSDGVGGVLDGLEEEREREKSRRPSRGGEPSPISASILRLPPTGTGGAA